MDTIFRFTVLILLLPVVTWTQSSHEMTRVEFSVSAVFHQTSSISRAPEFPYFIWREQFGSSQVSATISVPFCQWLSVTGGIVYVDACHRLPVLAGKTYPEGPHVEDYVTACRTLGVLTGLQFSIPIVPLTHLIVRPQIAYGWSWYSQTDIPSDISVDQGAPRPAFGLPMATIGLKIGVTKEISVTPTVQIARRYPFGQFTFYELRRTNYAAGIDISLSL